MQGLSRGEGRPFEEVYFSEVEEAEFAEAAGGFCVFEEAGVEVEVGEGRVCPESSPDGGPGAGEDEGFVWVGRVDWVAGVDVEVARGGGGEGEEGDF